MPDPELSSLAAAVEDLARRVANMADAKSGGKREGAAAELFEAERALRSAAKRLSRIADHS